MTRQNIATIDKQLRTAGIATKDGLLRSRLAGAVHHTGVYFGANEAKAVMAHFAAGYVGGAIEEFMHAALMDGTWQAVAEDVTEPEPVNKHGSSHDDLVKDDNPYGLVRSKLLREHYDHDEPGKWNAYRQCYNLTEEERVQRGAADCKIRGRTRFGAVNP